jgi:hypothetical protein
MSEFIYLYRGGRRGQTPEESETIMGKWVAWMQSIGASLKDRGQPLEPEGKVVASNGAVTDGPFAEAKDIVGGYTLVEADTIAKACEFARGCPILEVGGSVEVRPVMQM